MGVQVFAKSGVEYENYLILICYADVSGLHAGYQFARTCTQKGFLILVPRVRIALGAPE